MLAHARQTMTYVQLGQLIGYHPRPLRYVLGHVMNYCASEGLPPLTAVIVSHETGRPGIGLTTIDDFVLDLKRVYALNWWNLLPPTDEELRATSLSQN